MRLAPAVPRAAVMSWPKLRALGAGLWLTDQTPVLRATAEALAKAQYAVGKDPHEPALMYAALGKKAVLQGLFRSSGNKKVGYTDKASVSTGPFLQAELWDPAAQVEGRKSVCGI